MKTVCKKLLCLMLVAMMLVSAVPFAFAADAVPVPVQVIYQAADGTETTKDGAVYDNITSVSGILDAFGDWSIYNIAKYDIRKEGQEPIVGNGNDAIDLVGATQVWVRVIQNPDICTHPESKLTTTNTATCGAAGVKTVKCACGYVISEEKVEATGKHNYVGASCTGCDATRNPIASITFHSMNGNETVSIYEELQQITAPNVDLVEGYEFQGWSAIQNGAATIYAGDVITWNSGTPTDFYAIYDDDGDDNLVKLNVWVVYRNDNNTVSKEYLTGVNFVKNENSNKMFRWLYGEGMDVISELIFGDGKNSAYKWNELYYHDFYGDNDVTAANMKDDGSKSVYVILNSKDYIESDVQIYVHKSKSSTIYDIVPMYGYAPGSVVKDSAVKSALKDEGYKWSSISDLYTDAEWEDLLAGENTSGAESVVVRTNGLTKIHVILKGASQSSNADSSNPKTGDSITIAATTMVLAAAALVSVIELKKRKMI